ncbi:MAG TPA: N-6 DNA methylase [Methanocella sp.]|nr:N-6 DNA methylase [Methanocella sp.]
MIHRRDRVYQSAAALNIDAGPGIAAPDLCKWVRQLGRSIAGSNLRLHGYGSGAISTALDHFCDTFEVMTPEDVGIRLPEVVDPASFDLLGRAYEDSLHANGIGQRSGEYYSPPEVVSYMVDSLALDVDERLPERKFIDVACGTGIFLASAMKNVVRIQRSRGVSGRDILATAPDRFYGLDINPVSCEITKINLYLTLLGEVGPDVLADTGNMRFNVFCTDAIENRPSNGEDEESFRIKCRKGAYEAGFDYILGNPPYLEAKKMPAQTKAICKSSFPELKGAFDLYMAFICQCNRLVADNGKIHLILPDKFTVANYAKRMREYLLDHTTLLEVTDLSGMDIFSRATVYPLLLYYQNRPPEKGHHVRTRISVRRLEELLSSDSVPAAQGFYKSVGQMSTIFCVPEGHGLGKMLETIFKSGTRIGEYVSFRSTVSFHRKGLREQFVRKRFDGSGSPLLFKYLGGESYAKKNEVRRLGFDWQGYYINYDRASLKRLGNPLPPVENFLQEKIVLCQHAKRITAAYDEKGEYVSKDVYPIGFAGNRLDSSPFSMKYFAGLLDSELMSFIYGTVYKGIQIGGGYYHYLPTWLETLPVIVPDEGDIRQVETLVDKLIAHESSSFREPTVGNRLIARLDDIVYGTYGVTLAQRTAIHRLIPQ